MSTGKTSRAVWSMVSVATVVAFGIAWYFARSAGTLEAERAAIVKQRAASIAKVQAMQQRLDAVTAERDRQEATLRELKIKAASPKPTAPAKPQVKLGPTIDERLQNEPDTQVYWLASQRSQVVAKYRAFVRQAGLSAEQIEAFYDALIKRDEQVMDVSSIIRKQGLAQPDEATAKLLAKADTDLKDAQRALLGEEGFRQLTEYNRTSWLRELVNGIVGGAVVVAREPLTAQQAEQLLQVMANASPSYQRGGSAGTSDVDWDIVDAQARAFLSPAQYALLTTMEPPLPVGARFQSKLYREVNNANKRAKAESSKPKPSGE